MPSSRTLLDKIWDNHLICSPAGENPLIYIDRHLVHEVTSAQAFEGLRLAGRRVRRPEATFATPDHNVPTTDRRLPIADPISIVLDIFILPLLCISLILLLCILA